MPYFLRNYPDSKKVKENSVNFWSRKREIVYKLDISVLKTCGFMIYSMEMLNIWILNPKSQRTYALVSTRQSWFMVFLGLNINSNPFHLKKKKIPIGTINYMVALYKINQHMFLYKQSWHRECSFSSEPFCDT